MRARLRLCSSARTGEGGARLLKLSRERSKREEAAIQPEDPRDEERPVDVALGDDGALLAKPTLTCTLAADHRVVDGAVGAQWLAALKGLVENPTTLLL